MTTNLKEAKELVKRYRSITVEELTSIKYYEKYAPCDLLTRLTGFGKPIACTLCAATMPPSLLNKDCDACLYSTRYPDKTEKDIYYCTGINGDRVNRTYNAIENARTIKGLLTAIKNRANCLERVINDYEKEIEHDRT